MNTGITFHAQYSRSSLEEVRRAVEQLLATLPTEGASVGAAPQAREASDTAEAGLAKQKADRLRQHLSSTLRDFLKNLADNHDPRETFTWDDIAERMGKDLKTVRSWHRILSRPMKRIDADLGREPRLFHSNWDGRRNHYRMTEEWREAILAWS